LDKLFLVGKEKEQNNKNNRSQCCQNYKIFCLHSIIVQFIIQFNLLTTYENFLFIILSFVAVYSPYVELINCYILLTLL
jgi:hypothetical protein